MFGVHSTTNQNGRYKWKGRLLTLISYKAMAMRMKTTHADFVQGDGDANGNEDYSR